METINKNRPQIGMTLKQKEDRDKFVKLMAQLIKKYSSVLIRK